MVYLTGLKKQMNKANQFMSEKISGVEGTKFDDDFNKQEKRTDLFVEFVDNLIIKTKEYLQPDPTVRAKMAASKGMTKFSTQAKSSTYPQPEGTLGELMLTYGQKLQDFDEESIFASSLMESGEAMKSIADCKYALDDSVKQNFLEPLIRLQSKDLKEVALHRKKLTGRRLDYDCNKRKYQSGGNVPAKELKISEDKFAESFKSAQIGMNNIMEGEVEYISQLVQFMTAVLEYHKQCSNILPVLIETLEYKTSVASSRDCTEFIPKGLEDIGVDVLIPTTMEEETNTSCKLAAQCTTFTDPSSSESVIFTSRPQSTSQENYSSCLLEVEPCGKTVMKVEESRSSSFQASSCRSYAESVISTSKLQSASQENYSSCLLEVEPWDMTGMKVEESETIISESVCSVASTMWPNGSALHQKDAEVMNLDFDNNFTANSIKIESSRETPTYKESVDSFATSDWPDCSASHQKLGITNLDFDNNFTCNTISTSPLPLTNENQPTAQALFQFDPENASELGFSEGDTIMLIRKIDENWFQGSIHGKIGMFPVNFVKVLTPLP